MLLCRTAVLLSLVCSCLANAQSFGGGVKGGWTPTEWVETAFARQTSEDQSGRYTVGPYVEVRLPLSIAVEAAALYRPYGVTSSFSGPLASTYTSLEGRSWEFPVTAKYRFPLKPLTPFVLAGVAFRNLGTQTGVGECRGDCGGNEGISAITREGFTTAGFVGGLGLEWKAGPIRLAVEGRYTRYGAPDESQFGPNFINPNQAAVLFSLGF